MSGVTINDAIGVTGTPNINEEFMTGPEPMGQPSQSPSRLLDVLKSETAQGDIEEYQKHMLNFDGSKAVGRMIRGLEGIAGSLNFAVLDIVLGFMEYTKKIGGSN